MPDAWLSVGEKHVLRVHVDVHLKAGSAVACRSLLVGEILPALGDRDFRSIKRADIQELHVTMKSRPGAANNMVPRHPRPLLRRSIEPQPAGRCKRFCGL